MFNGQPTTTTTILGQIEETEAERTFRQTPFLIKSASASAHPDKEGIVPNQYACI